jgi:hypothetical protein
MDYTNKQGGHWTVDTEHRTVRVQTMTTVSGTTLDSQQCLPAG